ncbi:MAG: glycosyltransferase family 2 protein [Deltaproteobacteria bacterium]|nr:glycosyltransferase family 2 protein [Deltaproteobacteria bacterium]
MNVTIVIPCYNEAETVPRLVAALDAAEASLRSMGRETEMILVDDGSRDGSFPMLREATLTRPWMRLIRFRRNYGQTAAMAAGFKAARGDVIIPMDADLQNDPADIPRLLEKLDEGFDVVSGWRRDRKDKVATRKLPSWIANWVIGFVSGVKLHDYGCTLKAYKREFLDEVNLYGEMHRFIPIYAKWAGARVTEMVVTHHPRREGKSKYGLMRTFKVLLDLITVKFLGDYSTKPLYFFGGLGFTLCAGGIVTAAYTLFQRFAEHAYVHRNPLFVVSVFLFMLGVQFIMMGLIAELQIRTYHESQAKTTYLIGETVNFESARLPNTGTIIGVSAGTV